MIGRRSEDRAFYEAMKLPRYAPPGWLFPPVWAINNAFTLWGNLRLLNQPVGTPGRRPMLALQGMSWALFSTFGFVYFRKRSPILAAVWTATDWALTAATVAIAAKNGQGDIVKSQATKFAWLSLAVPVSSYQGLHNPDPLFGTRPGRPAAMSQSSWPPAARRPDATLALDDQPEPDARARP
jgi:tryptophan-rich sensory protein